MGQPIEKRSCHLRVPKHRPPFRETQVGGNDQACLLVQLADEVKKQSSASLAEGQIAQLIKDHQISVKKPYSKLASAPLLLF